MTNASHYVPPTLTVDSVIFRLTAGVLEVLLIQRAREPFAGTWALPGGYSAAGETTTESMQRILLAKGGVPAAALNFVEQLYTFDTVARDPRGHAVSVTYLGLATNIEPDSNSQNAHFFPVDALPELAYDHLEIIHYAVERLQSKLYYTNVVFALLPDHFTLTELQQAYETILDRPLDKRNFRKKFLGLGLIHETNDMKREGAHRPARLYAFNKSSLEELARSFD